MTRIILASDSTELESQAREATGDCSLTVLRGPLPASPAELFARLDDTAMPEVVVLDAGSGDPLGALNLAAAFDQQFPAVSVVLISDAVASIGLTAMRAGVRDVVHPQAGTADLAKALSYASEVARARRAAGPAPAGAQVVMPEAQRGRVINVVSPKGGVGKTTVATNLAVGLAQTAPHSTVLVDLDIQFGDVASALSLEPEYSLVDAIKGPGSSDTLVLKTFLSLHPTGLYAICGPDSPASADGITADEVARMLRMLASEFRYVVVDTAPGLSEHTLAAMDESTDMVLLSSMDVPGVRGLRKEVDVLTELNLGTDSRHLVLNFAEKHGGLSKADVEATIGTGVDVLLPRSKAVVTSVNEGVPLLQSGVNDPMTKQLRMLVNRFVPDPAPVANERKAAKERSVSKERKLPREHSEVRESKERAARKEHRLRGRHRLGRVQPQ